MFLMGCAERDSTPDFMNAAILHLAAKADVEFIYIGSESGWDSFLVRFDTQKERRLQVESLNLKFERFPVTKHTNQWIRCVPRMVGRNWSEGNTGVHADTLEMTRRN